MHTSAKFKDALTKFAVLLLQRAADRVKNGPRKCETFLSRKTGRGQAGHARTHARTAFSLRVRGRAHNCAAHTHLN